MGNSSDTKAPFLGDLCGDHPKKRHGVRIGECKYSMIFTDLPFFANDDTLKSCAQVIEYKQVTAIRDRVASIGFFSFLIRRLQVQVLSGVF